MLEGNGNLLEPWSGTRCGHNSSGLGYGFAGCVDVDEELVEILDDVAEAMKSAKSPLTSSSDNKFSIT